LAAARFPRGRALGPEGERAARAFLEAGGLRALAANVRTPFGEIDLLLEDPASGAVVVAEVKARAGAAFGAGAEAVTPAKRRRLARAALHALAERGLADRPVRFDVVALATNAEGRAGIEHVRDAFQIDDAADLDLDR
jgi:putative endonuclease